MRACWPSRMSFDRLTPRIASSWASEISSGSASGSPSIPSSRFQTRSSHASVSAVVDTRVRPWNHAAFAVRVRAVSILRRISASKSGARRARSDSSRNRQNTVPAYDSARVTNCSSSSTARWRNERSIHAAAPMRPSSNSSQSVTSAAPRAKASGKACRSARSASRLASSSRKSPYPSPPPVGST